MQMCMYKVSSFHSSFALKSGHLSAHAKISYGVHHNTLGGHKYLDRAKNLHLFQLSIKPPIWGLLALKLVLIKGQKQSYQKNMHSCIITGLESKQSLSKLAEEFYITNGCWVIKV